MLIGGGGESVRSPSVRRKLKRAVCGVLAATEALLLGVLLLAALLLLVACRPCLFTFGECGGLRTCGLPALSVLEVRRTSGDSERTPSLRASMAPMSA